MGVVAFLETGKSVRDKNVPFFGTELQWIQISLPPLWNSRRHPTGEPPRSGEQQREGPRAKAGSRACIASP